LYAFWQGYGGTQFGDVVESIVDVVDVIVEELYVEKLPNGRKPPIVTALRS
jgi:hypothetical protein